MLSCPIAILKDFLNNAHVIILAFWLWMTGRQNLFQARATRQNFKLNLTCEYKKWHLSFYASSISTQIYWLIYCNQNIYPYCFIQNQCSLLLAIWPMIQYSTRKLSADQLPHMH